ncbi:MAG: ketoacyl-ACP synthase III [Candidatus Omnitrophica bacterium]|nr:ketoacyl-ACP synthase III [Candidatus Omnitrophota bacterium]
MTISVGITGLGAYLPERRLTNLDLEKMVETSDEWIVTRTGIKERRIAGPNESASDLGVKAAEEALKDARLTAKDIDLVIAATITPDMFFPSTACLIQHRIGADCAAFDIGAACSGFPYALAVAQGMIKSKFSKKVLVVGSEVLSKFVDWKDRSTCVLFGDGAGAAVVSEVDKDCGIIATYLGADGSQGDLLKLPAGGSLMPSTHETIDQGMHFLKMSGSEVFKVAVRSMSMAVNEVLGRAGYTIDKIDCLIPHQANYRILKAVAEHIEMPFEKVFVNVDRYGNMSSASTAVALYEAVKSGVVKKNSTVVLVSFGSGLTWASCLIKW